MGDIHPKPLLKKEDLVQPSSCGGLVVVGSHVPKTTVQLSQLLTTNIEAIEFEVASFLENEQSYLEAISQSINWLIGHNQDVVLLQAVS
ncbi:MAG: nucleotide-binding domain containing protein [Spirosomataceae bacterium]